MFQKKDRFSQKKSKRSFLRLPQVDFELLHLQGMSSDELPLLGTNATSSRWFLILILMSTKDIFA